MSKRIYPSEMEYIITTMSASSETRPAARPSMDIALAKLRQFEAEVSERNRMRRRHNVEVYAALNASVPREESGEPLAKRACVPHNTPVLRNAEEPSDVEEDLLSDTDDSDYVSETESESEDESEEETESEDETEDEDKHNTESETESEVEPEVLLDIPRQNIDWRAAYIVQVIVFAIYFIYIGMSIQKIYDSTR